MEGMRTARAILCFNFSALAHPTFNLIVILKWLWWQYTKYLNVYQQSIFKVFNVIRTVRTHVFLYNEILPLQSRGQK